MDLAAARMASQGLITPIGSATDVVRHLVGLQAQDDWIAPYALRPRAREIGGGTGQPKGGNGSPGGLIRIWAMRGTLHLVAVEDAGWLIDLLGPRFIAKFRGRRHQLGLTDDMVRQALPIIKDLMPATRQQIAAAIRKRGIDLPEGQAEPHLIMVAAMSGLIYRTSIGYERLPPTPSKVDNSLSELARRYLAAYGPAGPEDFAAWSGLPLTQARKGIAATEQPSPAITDLPTRMLGHFDPWLLGYKDRSFTLDPKYTKEIQRGGGFLQPIILVKGKVAGTWERTPHGIVPKSFGGKLPDLTEEIMSIDAIR